MSIPRGCICSAEGVYIYRGEGVHLSRGGVRLMPPYLYLLDLAEETGRKARYSINILQQQFNFSMQNFHDKYETIEIAEKHIQHFFVGLINR